MSCAGVPIFLDVLCKHLTSDGVVQFNGLFVVQVHSSSLGDPFVIRTNAHTPPTSLPALRHCNLRPRFCNATPPSTWPPPHLPPPHTLPPPRRCVAGAQDREDTWSCGGWSLSAKSTRKITKSLVTVAKSPIILFAAEQGGCDDSEDQRRGDRH